MSQQDDPDIALESTSDHSDQGDETPASDPGERAFAVGMVCFALAGLILVALRSDWWA